LLSPQQEPGPEHNQLINEAHRFVFIFFLLKTARRPVDTIRIIKGRGYGSADWESLSGLRRGKITNKIEKNLRIFMF
jgi:hypothetical protein